jgi:hypothetical protein
MEMEMIQQGLILGMEHRDETDLSAETSVTKINERFANGFEEMA